MTFPPYKPSLLLRNGDSNTIYSDLKRRLNPILPYKRKRLTTVDDDFIDLDYVKSGNKRIAYLLHGLESSSHGSYILGIGKLLHAAGWDIAAINYRSCSGEINRQMRVYHAGATDDVDFVLQDFVEEYEEVVLVGFSLGGNLALRYAGEKGTHLHPHIKSIVGVSVPIDLAKCSQALDGKAFNAIYVQMFLRSLKEKVKLKMEQFPEMYTLEKLKKIKKIKDFDDMFTGPIAGYKDAMDYYTQCSCKTVLANIKVPSLIINALDDPFLMPDKYEEVLKQNPLIESIFTTYGGHVGFSYLGGKISWSEQVIFQYLHRSF
ncbi:MAG: alpha/beta fold hydrolase [Bacteroidota bacterium]